MAENDLAAAAALFAQAQDYKDAKQQAAGCADQYYAEAYRIANQAMDDEDYKTAIDALAGLSRDYLNDTYDDIPKIYNEAWYRYANELYSQQQPFEALKYYRQIEDYKDVSEKRLDKVVYRIMGKWESSKGAVMEFREDGTCTIDGRDYYYYAGMYALDIGDRADDLEYTYNILSNTKNKLTLRHEKQNILYRMDRVTE